MGFDVGVVGGGGGGGVGVGWCSGSSTSLRGRVPKVSTRVEQGE